MKILVISDIHAYTKPRQEGYRPSLVRAGDTGDNSLTTRFLQLVRDGDVPKPDLVVTPGDLGDQADQSGLEFAWRFLRDLADLSTQNLLLGTAGNHDVDSRYHATDHDPKGMLLGLNPKFPVVASQNTVNADVHMMQLKFWTYNSYIITIGEIRFVVLNSSAYHGMGRENSEFEHGRISAYTLGQLKRELEADDQRRASKGDPRCLLNVLLCHHHLGKDGLADDPDHSLMVNAHALVDMMSCADHGRWMVIHGHRHRARLFQTGGTTGPFVLSAASFAATRDRDYDNTSPNQAHLVELDSEGMVTHDFYPAGQIRSWTWQSGMGWLSERFGEGGLPPLTGFGFRGSVDALARTISAHVTNPPCKWSAICEKEPQAAYLDYTQFRDLRKILKLSFGVHVLIGEDGQPVECGRTP